MANRRFIDFPVATTVGANDIILIWQDGLNKQTTKATILSGLPEDLEDLADVNISGLTNGQILRYDSTTGKWENTDQGNLDLNDLNDVSIVSPSNGQVLVYNSSTSKWENSSGGFVPYTGAVTTVNLGAQTIQAGSFVKQGGTSAQFLKADGSVDSTAYGTGSVTSVGLTMPSAFNVGSSPITTNGTLAVTGAGTTAQYVRGDGSLATFPGLTGFVPYTGATADVNLGTHDLTAERGTFENNGSSDTLTVNHTSGSGKGINVSKGGNGEALLVTKTSGSGNAMAVVGGRTSLVDLSLSSVSNETGNFLTISGGVVHQRTPSETRSDVGAQAQLNGTGFVKASGTTITYDNSTYQVTSEKAQPNGYASLDSNGKVPLVQINDALIGNVDFQDLWNAATNTPTLANPPASGTKGYYYIVTTKGTFAGIDFEVGDWIISNGTAWGKVDNTDAVSSVFGRTGNVTASNGDYNTSQVTELTNLYYTEARVNANTNVAANTAARHAAVTLGTANGLSLNVQQLSLGLASAGVTGALSGTDWSTFNSKQQALNGTGFVKISGTTISYDNSTYLTTAAAASTYLPLAGGTMTGALRFNEGTGFGRLAFTDNYHGMIIRGIPSDALGNVTVGDYTSLIQFSGDFRFYRTNGTINELYFQVNPTAAYYKGNVILHADNFNSYAPTLSGTGATGTWNIAINGNAGTANTWSTARTITIGNTGKSVDGSSNVAWSLSEIGAYAATNPSAFIALTALSGTAPIQYNNTTGAISITQSSGSTNGFLSSTDWNTFNNKTSNVGTVTSVAALTLGTTGTDLSSSVANGTTTPVITLNVPTASAANRGALSAADWTTFNSKENAITAGTTAQYYRGDKTFQTLNTAAVPELTNLYYTEARVSANTDVAANTAARHNAVTLGTANGLSLSTQQLSLGLASSSANGALSSTDWTTFNNKQNALTNPVTGTGTAGQVAFWSSGSAITGEANLFWDATNDRLGIGTATPATRLSVSGDITLQLLGAAIRDVGNSAILSVQNTNEIWLGGGGVGYFTRFYAGGTEKMRLDSSGNLGIGRDIAVHKLDINGTARVGTSGYTDTLFRSLYIGRRSFDANFSIINLNPSSGNNNFGFDIGVYDDGTAGNQYLYIGDNRNSERIRITSSGNLGLRVTPSAWGTNVTALELPQSVSLYSWNASAVPQLYFGANHYWDGSNWKYKITGQLATLYYQATGQHQWFTAPSGTSNNNITFTQAMTLGTNSGLSIGTGSAAPSQGLLTQGAANFNSTVNATNGYLGGGANFTNIGQASNSPSNISANIGVLANTYAFIDLSTQHPDGGWIDFSKGNGTDYGGRIRYFNSVDQFRFYTNASGTAALTIASTGAATFSSSVSVNGSFSTPHTTKSANYTLTASDYTVGFDCASNRTATLPDATTCEGRIYVIYQYNTNNGTRYVTIDPNGSQTINAITTYPLQSYGDFSSVMIQSTGSNWVVISDALYFIPL
jgi:hypothetical protein